MSICKSSTAIEQAIREANVQRLLWASTSTKDPHYSDVMYVDALIGRDTVNTLPMLLLIHDGFHPMVGKLINQRTHYRCNGNGEKNRFSTVLPIEGWKISQAIHYRRDSQFNSLIFPYLL